MLIGAVGGGVNEGVNEGDDLIALDDAPGKGGQTVCGWTQECASPSSNRLKRGRWRARRCGQTDR